MHLQILEDIVLIKDDKLKRSQWRIGRICKLIYSNDGLIRAAEVDVMTNDKVVKLKRPINRLYPVEFTKSDTNGQNEPHKNDENERAIRIVSDNDTYTFLIFGGVC